MIAQSGWITGTLELGDVMVANIDAGGVELHVDRLAATPFNISQDDIKKAGAKFDEQMAAMRMLRGQCARHAVPLCWTANECDWNCRWRIDHCILSR